MYSKHEWATKNSRNLQTLFKMWREGYDYPSDDEEQEDDFFERADHDYEQQNDK